MEEPAVGAASLGSLHLPGGGALTTVRSAGEVEEVGMGWRVGRGLLACVYVAAVLALLLAVAVPLALLLAWRMSPPALKASQALQFDYRSAQPSAEMALKAAGWRAIPKGQPYKVQLALTLPESDHNRALGMFQVTAEALSSERQVLARSSVPCMLRWRSLLVRLAREMIFALPLLAGLLEDHQVLKLDMLRTKEGVTPTAAIRVLLEPKSGLSPAQGLPELYAAQLTIDSSPSGLGALLRFLQLTSLVWVLVALLSFELLLLLICCRSALLPRLWRSRALPDVPQDVAMAFHVAEAAEELAKRRGVDGGEDPPSLEVSDIDEEDMPVGASGLIAAGGGVLKRRSGSRNSVGEPFQQARDVVGARFSSTEGDDDDLMDNEIVERQDSSFEAIGERQPRLWSSRTVLQSESAELEGEPIDEQWRGGERGRGWQESRPNVLSDPGVDSESEGWVTVGGDQLEPMEAAPYSLAKAGREVGERAAQGLSAVAASLGLRDAASHGEKVEKKNI